MSSKYPQQYDTFTTKKDRITEIINGQEVITQDGDDILASHVNDLQDSIIAVQNELGVNPSGSFLNISQRLDAISGISQLSIPSIFIHQGNAKDINGYDSKELAAEFISKFNVAIIGMESVDSVRIDQTTACYVVNNIPETVNLYMRINCIDPLSTVLKIKNDISIIKSVGAKGVFLDNFDYTALMTRAVQNDIIDYCHNNGLLIITSSVKPEDVLGSSYVNHNNESYTISHLRSGDAFIYKGFAIASTGYQDLATMYNSVKNLIYLKDSLGISLYTSSYISAIDSEMQEKYFYITTAAMLYCIDAIHVGDLWTDTSKIKYSNMPLIGKFRSDVVNINYTTDGNKYYRDTDVGQIVLYKSSGKYYYDFPDLKIPGEFIDSYGLHLDASKIDFSNFDAGWLQQGNLGSDRMSTNVIEAIINSPADQLIPMSKLDQTDNSYVETVVKATLPVFDYARIKSTGDLYITPHLKTYITGAVDSDSDITITGVGKGFNAPAGYVSAQQGIFEKINISGSLEARNIKVDKMLNTPTILPTANLQILSNMLEVATKAGLNKFNIKVFKSEHTDGIIYTKEQIEAMTPIDEYASAGTKVTSYLSLIGEFQSDSGEMMNASLLDGSVVEYSTKFKVSEQSTFNISIYKYDANCAASVYLDSTLIGTIPSGTLFQTLNVTIGSENTFPNGQELSVIVESHNHADPSIKITPIITNTLDGQLESVDYTLSDKILRIDCYMDKTTKIRGDLIETGTVKAKHIEAKAITADQIKAGTITGDLIQGKTISGEHIQAGSITADSAIIAAAAIKNANIDNGAITNAKIGNAEITSAKVLELDASKIQSGYILSDRIEAGSIIAEKLSVNSVTADKIESLSIQSRHIQSDAINAEHIQVNTITAASAIIAVGAILSANIANAQIKTAHIDVGQINNAHILDATIESAKIKELNGDKITANSIDVGKFSASVQQTLSDVETVKTTLNVQQGQIDMKAEQSYVQSIENNLTYKVEIISSNGSIFRRGNIDTILTARVYHGSTDITDTLSNTQFVWHRTSADSAGDIVWDNAHVSMKSVHLTSSDIYVRATFNCDILQ